MYNIFVEMIKNSNLSNTFFVSTFFFSVLKKRLKKFIVALIDLSLQNI